MLKHLFIKNYTLVSHLDIDFGSGFSVITGETGAGKSIILGAVNLLLGQRADTKCIQEGFDRCIIEAHFSFSDDSAQDVFRKYEIEYDASDCIVRREMHVSGKSRAFINDTPVPLTVLKELGEKLMDIHSQHQNLLVNNEEFQLNVVDIVADNKSLLGEYTLLYSDYNKAAKKLATLTRQSEETKENEEFIRYQLEELQNANLRVGEDDELKEECTSMTYAEDIKSALFNSDIMLSGSDNEQGILSKLSSICSQILPASTHLTSLKQIYDNVESAYVELQEVSRELSSILQDIEYDPDRLDKINERIFQLSTLQKKYRVASITELIQKRDELEKDISLIENTDEELLIAQQELNVCRIKLTEQASLLTSRRKQIAAKIEDEMQQRLIPLGIPNVRFEVHVDSKAPSENGADKVQFYFSANKNTTLQPISQVASGGEIARVMLSIKAMVSGAIELPTIIFDEIDTGISGSIAEKMAEIMNSMGNNGRQVISITHLPQIAAKGQQHYKVFKEDKDLFSETNMISLSPEQRITEIAGMLSGSEITDEAISNAKALLKITV
ncbi:MAG: DNA repair protein RecN [Prevotellaceae bacterium]|nr:DNA repair protein RecN [Prevotellaceae bacterium]